MVHPLRPPFAGWPTFAGQRAFYLIICVALILTGLSFATTPQVTVSTPVNSSGITSPVQFVASATSSQCPQGVSAIGIYTSPGVLAYVVNSSQLNTQINLQPGTYNTVVQAWDECGGAGKIPLTITVTSDTYPEPRFLYTTEYNAGKIAGYLVNPTSGALTATGQSPVWAHWGPVRVASDKGGYRLYVANQGSQDLSAYFIDRDNGYLTAVPGSPFGAGGTGTYVAVHPSGDYVYETTDTSHGGNAGVTVFAVQSNGSLKQVPGSPFSTSGDPEAVAVDSTGSYLYVDITFSNQIDGFSIDKVNGALTPLPGSPYLVPSPPNCSNCSSTGEYDWLPIRLENTCMFLAGERVR